MSTLKTRQYEQATARLEATAAKIDQYAGTDAELRQIAESLRERHMAYSMPMTAQAQEVEYFGSRT